MIILAQILRKVIAPIPKMDIEPISIKEVSEWTKAEVDRESANWNNVTKN